MTVVGYSTLEVIPSMKGLGRELEKQSSQFSSAGRKGGQKFGDAAGREAGSRFKTGLNGSLKGFVAPFAGVLAGAGIADFFRDSFAEAKEAGQVARVTAKLIETTGKSAGLTAVQIGNLSERMMDYAAVDDELIQSGANVLLTFRNVRNEIGEGNQIFDRSVKAGLDLAAVLGTDLSGSALQLGKALNDPVKGMTALGRAGVQFTAAQKEQIKGFVAAGDLLNAQKAILAEVEQQVGGAAGAAADGTQRLSVAMGNLKESVGTELMPAVEAFSSWAVSDGIPALSAAGGAAKDAVQAFDGLPGPVKAAAAAFVALKLAAALGITSAVASGAASAGSAITGMRVRTMLARDAFNATSGAAGRLAGSLAAVRAASVGAGAALRSGLGRASALVGGPWGAAFIAGTVILTKFWGEQQKAKQHVEALTDSLNKQSGQTTKQTWDEIFKILDDSGVIDDARKFGVALTDVREAALGNDEALARVNAQLQAYGRSLPDVAAGNAQAAQVQANFADASHDLIGALTGSNEKVKEAVQSWKDHASFTGKAATATDNTTASLSAYQNQIAGARSELQKLIDAENKRALAAIQTRRDAIALRETFRSATAEAKEGNRVLFDGSKAADANMSSLLDLANQWDTSTKKAQAAVGGYEGMRKKFVEVAIQMGATKKQAENLATELLQLPKKPGPEFQSKGYQKTLAEILRLKAEAEALRTTFRLVYATQATNQQAALADRRAMGGPIYGRGTGTSDSNLIWASKGEFMQRKAAVDYYGMDFMRRLNALQIPKFAQGGPIATPAPRAVAASGGVHIHIGQVVAHDYGDFMSQMTKRTQKAQSDGARMGGR